MEQYLAVAIPNRETGKIDLVNYYELKEGETPSQEELDRALEKAIREYREQTA